jgi:hypothetical protein
MTSAAIDEVTASARNTASDTVAAARETLSATYDSGVETAGRAGDQLTKTFQQSRDTVIETIESHPLVVGGIGLLIGAGIALALPVTQAENRLFGETSDDLKDQARDLASEGLHIAQTAAQDVYDESVARAQDAGLSADVVRDTIRAVGDKVTEVVQQASETLDKRT